MTLDARIPEGPIETKWRSWLDAHRLVGPANRPKHTVVVVGTGLAGASCAASLSAQGFKVKSFCYQDSPRRAHSIAAQGGINAAKDFANEGDATRRLFVDTIKGGDFRSREANVWRLAELSQNIIDQAVAQGVPFAREYGGQLATRSFGGVLVQRTFYARGQTGQQLLLGAYQALEHQVNEGGVEVFNRHEMLDVVLVDGEARGIIARNLVTGEIERHAADAVVIASGGYSNAFYLSTNAMGSNVTAAWKATKRGALFANPCYTQIHPTCIPQSGEYQSKLTLMSESLRNDGRVWVPRKGGDDRPPAQIPEEERYYFLEERYPAFGNLVPRDIASRAAKIVCDDGLGVGGTGRGVYLDFRDPIAEQGRDAIQGKYQNLFEMYERITGDDPFETPMMIYPAPHYTMGGLWVDYELQTTVPGLFAIGEANFSDHGANRLGASALMQALADGYFIAPHTVMHRLATSPRGVADESHPAFDEAEANVRGQIDRLMSIQGTRAPQAIHRELGRIMLDKCGMLRTRESLTEAIDEIRAIRESFWTDLRVDGSTDELNPSLEYAWRLADFIDLSEVMCEDALRREESCGGHFRGEHETEDGEALRDDDQFAVVTAWQFDEHGGDAERFTPHDEPLIFNEVKLATRSYK
jgi:succinate dehydrogenase / fumarate reductase flavoprotein subunit